MLPPDLLTRVLDTDSGLEGTKPEDYGLTKGERLNQVITQSWSRLQKHWEDFRSTASALPDGEAGTGVTNDKWNLPLLRELGLGLLPTSAGPEIGGRTYAISRFFGPVPVHLIGCGLSLDRRARGQRAAAAVNPHGLVQDYLNRSEDHLWAIVTNGLLFRILRDSQALSRQSYLEFDLEAIFEGEIFSDFVLYWLIAHATRFMPPEGQRPEACRLEQWTREAQKQGTRALGDLRVGVEKALQVLGEGFTSHPKNVDLREQLRAGDLALNDFHGQLLRVVYRLIFLFVAEDRTLEGQSLLHTRDDSEKASLARNRYAAYYSGTRLRDMASQIKGSRHGDLWQQFQLLVQALSGDESCAVIREHLALPALGSFLWSPGSTTSVSSAELINYDFLESLRHLAFTRQGEVLRPVDYRNLGSEELGGVYESLLALTPQISADGVRFYFAEFSGSERKTSGSYYTPDSLVQCLLDSALDPVVEEAIKGKIGSEAEEAILGLKVCDPAVGSGHFLVGAAHRLARHLARIRALADGESEPSPLLYQHALRDVIGRCLYGVDLNPMAAELCRVSLWLEALEPGKPLSFLDHHIRVGNSLLGTTPELIAAGIPDDAFKPIEGDDKKYCAALKKRNKQEREGRQMGLGLPMVAEPHAEYESLAARSRAIDATSDASIKEIVLKVEQFRRLVVSPEYRHAQQVADTWCSAFIWLKRADTTAEPITTDILRRLEGDPDVLGETQCTELERLSDKYQFFHWHLAFPEVFEQGGFNCIIGNPPWDKVKFQEREWFANSRPKIADAQTSDTRHNLIDELRLNDPTLYTRYKQAVRRAQALSLFYKVSNLYPLGAVGDLNTYPLFTELALRTVKNHGRVGIIVKTGILSDFTMRGFFAEFIKGSRLVSAYDFSNKRSIFPDVVANERFTLLTFTGKAGKSGAAVISILNESIDDLNREERQWTLAAEDVANINPNTFTCPLFQQKSDAELIKHIYRFHPVIIRETSERKSNPWGVRYIRMFDMSTDSGLFVDEEFLAEKASRPLGGGS